MKAKNVLRSFCSSKGFFKWACMALAVLPLDFAYSAERVELVRHIVVESCSEDLVACQQVSAETPTRIDIPLVESGKAKGGHLHGETRFSSTQANTPFKGEIYVNKLQMGYSIYAVLRSGHGTKRQGVTKTIKIGSLNSFAPIELLDRPISIDGKTYRAKMSVSPASL